MTKGIFGGLNFLEKIKTVRREWPNKTPKQKWVVLCDIPRILLSIFGIRILEDCRVYWLSFFGSFLALNYFGLATYTLIYFGLDGRFIYGTRCLCGVGIVASVCFIFLLHFLKKKKKCTIIFFSSTCFYNHSLYAEHHFVCEMFNIG